jgi:glutathionylspermidine synthase
MDIHKISAYLTGRSPIAAKAILYFRKTVFVHMLHCAEGLYSKSRHAAETEQFELFYQEHKEQFRKVYHLMADDESRETYKAVVKFRMNRDFREIKHHIYYPQYFVKEIINCQKEIFVDGGAYIGDSIFALLKYAPAEEVHKIYAWEPDKENGEALSHNLDRIQKKNMVAVEWIPCALYKEQSLLTFDSGAGQSSKIGKGGDNYPRGYH